MFLIERTVVAMMWKQKIGNSALIVILLGLFILGSMAAAASAIDEALKQISETAERLCGTVATSGSATSIKVTGDVKQNCLDWLESSRTSASRARAI